MRTQFLILLFTLALLSCGEKTKETSGSELPENDKNVTESLTEEDNNKQEVKKTDPKPPGSARILNEEVFFTLNLKNESRFQPMHFESCPDASFMILGHFKKKKESGGHKLDSIRFTLYNSHYKEKLKIENVKLIDEVNDIINLKVVLAETKDEKPSVHSFYAGNIDKINKRKIFDLHLYKKIDDNDKPIEFPKCSDAKRPDIVNIGDHICKSEVPDPNS